MARRVTRSRTSNPARATGRLCKRSPPLVPVLQLRSPALDSFFGGWPMKPHRYWHKDILSLDYAALLCGVKKHRHKRTKSSPCRGRTSLRVQMCSWGLSRSQPDSDSRVELIAGVTARCLWCVPELNTPSTAALPPHLAATERPDPRDRLRGWCSSQVGTVFSCRRPGRLMRPPNASNLILIISRKR